MRPFYDARLEDLGSRDFVKIECECTHSETVTAAMLRTAGAEERTLIRDLQRRLRCRACGQKGRVDISLKWAD